MTFPVIRYHRDGRVIHVQTCVELNALGGEWFEAPAAVEPEPAVEPAAPAESVTIEIPLAPRVVEPLGQPARYTKVPRKGK